jgi:hypothetical protein
LLPDEMVMQRGDIESGFNGDEIALPISSSGSTISRGSVWSPPEGSPGGQAHEGVQVSLQKGLAASGREGRPISGKFEI